MVSFSVTLPIMQAGCVTNNDGLPFLDLLNTLETRKRFAILQVIMVLHFCFSPKWALAFSVVLFFPIFTLCIMKSLQLKL